MMSTNIPLPSSHHRDMEAARDKASADAGTISGLEGAVKVTEARVEELLSQVRVKDESLETVKAQMSNQVGVISVSCVWLIIKAAGCKARRGRPQ